MIDYEFAVQKFGGTSAAYPERAAEIFTADPDRNQLAFISAVGKRPDGIAGDQKGTDLLLQAHDAVNPDLGSIDLQTYGARVEAFLAKTREAYSMLGSQVLNDVLGEAAKLLRIADKNIANGYAWVGEWTSGRLFAELTGAVHIPSGLRFGRDGQLLATSSVQATARAYHEAARSGRQVVSDAYYGFGLTDSGRIFTPERGGSDTSGVFGAAALGRVLSGRVVNLNYTDTNGVMSADPKLIATARHIPVMTLEEAREQMHGIDKRNGVVHGDAISHGYNLGVPIWVRNTFDTSAPGTVITNSLPEDHGRSGPVIAISGREHIQAISIFDMGMAGVQGYVGRMASAAARFGLSISSIPSGEDRVKIILTEPAEHDALEGFEDYVRRHAVSGKAVEVRIKNGDVATQGAVYVVGQALTDPDTYTRTHHAVTGLMIENGFSIREVVSHEDSPSLALTVNGAAVEPLMKLLHAELIENRQPAN